MTNTQLRIRDDKLNTGAILSINVYKGMDRVPVFIANSAWGKIGLNQNKIQISGNRNTANG